MEDSRTYKCGCTKIWKFKSNKYITPDIVMELLTKGHTGILDGFKTQNGQPFSRALELKDGKVVFKSFENTELAIKIASSSAGKVHLYVPNYINTTVNYGLMPAREAECLGTITAVNIIKHQSILPKLEIKISNREFAQYLLRERASRSSEIMKAMNYLWGLLDQFPSWEVKYQPGQKTPLQGSPRGEHFPSGIFPHTSIDVSEDHNNGILIVTLPYRPDMIHQFQASIPKVEKQTEQTFALPMAQKPMVMAWIHTVKEPTEIK